MSKMLIVYEARYGAAAEVAKELDRTLENQYDEAFGGGKSKRK